MTETPAPTRRLGSPTAARLSRMALEAISRHHPYHLTHVVLSDADARAPRDLFPLFCGAYDWHSAVHGHWTVVRLLRLFPAEDFSIQLRLALGKSFRKGKVAGELATLSRPERVDFERPYGLAWLLRLAAELREWTGQGEELLAILEPLERLAARRLAEWLLNLSYPVRSGEHSQTAFATGLLLDWSRTSGDASARAVAASRALDFFAGDRDAPLGYEPSGHDFLSPILGEADLMRRVLGPAPFSSWLLRFLPGIPKDGSAGWLRPAAPTSGAGGRLVHLHGLNLSRAFMLEGIARGLPEKDPRHDSLLAAAEAHEEAGLTALSETSFASTHWLATFAAYLLTERGLR
jgi:hypothetical protein